MSRRFELDAAGRRPLDSAERVVLGWARWYTRGLAPAVAGDRLDELVSDVWEHRAHDLGRRRPTGTAFAMVARTARGIPHDLSWRRSALRDQPPSSVGQRSGWAERAPLIAVLLTAAVSLGWAGMAWARIAVAALRHDPLSSTTTLTGMTLGTAALLFGLLLLRRPRRRSAGAVLLGAGGVAVLHFGFVALTNLGVTGAAFWVHAEASGATRLSTPLAWTALGALLLFHLALALAWVPRSTKEIR